MKVVLTMQVLLLISTPINVLFASMNINYNILIIKHVSIIRFAIGHISTCKMMIVNTYTVRE